MFAKNHFSMIYTGVIHRSQQIITKYIIDNDSGKLFILVPKLSHL